MKNITLLFCLFLANILLGACSGGEDEKKKEWMKERARMRSFLKNPLL